MGVCPLGGGCGLLTRVPFTMAEYENGPEYEEDYSDPEDFVDDISDEG